MQNLAKSAIAATIASLPVFSLNANEISITLNARVEPRCEIVSVGQLPDGLANALRVSVSCNVPQYRLNLIGNDGPIAVKVSSESASTGTTNVVGNSMMVRPLRPGLHVFDIELPEGNPNEGMLSIQLDGY